ncbi:MAG TPA: hypothetical protein ENF51_01540, partial [Candidatus Aenigmarchaeota archaeon]|nr:hypothetical protein [Candidatus Aenigmarchaeota archaeon]
VKGVEEIFSFILENNLYSLDAQISAFIHPHISPSNSESSGVVISSYDMERKYALVEAIYGCAEGVQSLPHDRFLVDKKEKKIVRRDVREKRKCVVVRESGYVTSEVPLALRERQALKDDEILSMVEQAMKFEEEFGPFELEFSYMGGRLFYIQGVPYKPEKKEEDVLSEFVLKATSTKHVRSVVGRVIRVKGMEDVRRIGEGDIVFVDPKVILERKMDVVLAIARLSGNRVVLYPGTESATHSLLALKEAGHTIVFLPGMQEFEDGEMLAIRSVVEIKRVK